MTNQGVRGVKARLCPKAKELYALNYEIKEISPILSVSENTLNKWRKEDKIPGEGISGWDLARQQANEVLYEVTELIQELVRMGKRDPANSSIPDSVSKWNTVAKSLRDERRKAADWVMKLQNEEGGSDIDYPAVFLEVFKWLVKELGDIDSDTQQGVVSHMDTLIARMKEIHLK